MRPKRARVHPDLRSAMIAETEYLIDTSFGRVEDAWDDQWNGGNVRPGGLRATLADLQAGKAVEFTGWQITGQDGCPAGVQPYRRYQLHSDDHLSEIADD